MDILKKCCCAIQKKPIKKKYNSTPMNDEKVLLNIFEILDQRYLVRSYKPYENEIITRPYKLRKSKTQELIQFFESIDKKV